MSLLVAVKVMLVLAPLSRICGLLTIEPLERDVVHHQLAVDDGDADRFARAGPERRVADAVDVASHAAVAEHRRFEDVLPVDGCRLGGRGLAGDVDAGGGEHKDEDADG